MKNRRTKERKQKKGNHWKKGEKKEKEPQNKNNYRVQNKTRWYPTRQEKDIQSDKQGRKK